MLSDSKLKALKPTGKKFKVADNHGLFAVVMPNGSILWRMRYTLHGKKRELALGKYPAVSLASVRKTVLTYRESIERGEDPHTSHTKRGAHSDQITVTEAAELLLAEKAKHSGAEHVAKCRSRLLKHVIPKFGRYARAEVGEDEWRALITAIDDAGKNHMAVRVQGLVSEMYRTVRTKTGLKIHDPINEVKGAVRKKAPKNLPRITSPERFGQLLHAIDFYDGHWQVCLALRFLPLVFVRQKELRFMTWDDVDLQRALWHIPAAKIKKERDHLVPLSRQAVEILRQAHAISDSGLVFPGIKSPMQSLSEGTVGSALRSLGFERSEMVGHGFRGTAATLLNELGWDSKIVDFQLSHWEKSSVSAAYNHAEYLKQRTEMMQAWADYCDTLKAQVRQRLAFPPE